MKILTFKRKELVTSVYAAMNKTGLNLHISTLGRWTGYHRRGSTAQDLTKLGYDPLVEHDMVEVYGANAETDPDDLCEVVFIAENEEEADALRGMPFDCQEKDQIHYFFVDRYNMGDTKILGSLVD